MNQSLALGKRAIAIAAASMTILWSVGVSAFVAPLSAAAATPGTLVKGTTLSTVYYYASNGSRYAFPNEKTYLSWYSDFSGVQTISDSELASIPLAGNVVYRPGTRWIKIQSDPKTYVVTPQGQIRWIESEEVALGLAGADWNQMIDDVPDVFFVDYTVGTSLTSATNAFNGALVSMSGNTYLVWDGMKRLVTSAGFTANWFQTRNVLDGSGITLAGLTAGADITSRLNTLTDPAQLGETITGGLSVSLASDTAPSATVPASAASVPFAKFKLMSTGGSATVNQLIFKLGGVGVAGNIENVYLYDGNMRIADGRSVNSSTREVTFSGLNLSLSNGEAKYVTVRADISATPTGGDTANFSLASTSSVVGTATVAGNFPVTGNTMTFSETEAGTVTIDKNGTISNPTIGQEGAVIAKFSVEADDEDAMVKELTVNVDDAADHSNYKLWKGSTLLAAGTQNGDLVTFVLTAPLNVAEGDRENLQISADIGGESGDSIAVGIEEEADVFAIGGDFGFNMAVDIAAYDEHGGLCAGSGDDCSYSEIQGGELTFAFNGPASDDIQIDGDEQVLMRFTLTAEEFAEVQEIAVIVACDSPAGNCDEDADAGGLINAGTEANLQDIKIVRADSGATWMGPEELGLANADDDTQTLTFEDTQTLNAGQSIDLMIVADIDNGAVEGDVFRVTLDMSGVVAEDINGDALTSGTDIIPSSDIVGNLFTLTDSSLVVSVSTPPTGGSYVKGTQNLEVVGFSFEAGDASDVTVTDLTLNADADTAVAGAVADTDSVSDHVNSCSLHDSESGSLIDGPESFDTVTEEALFDNFAWTVPAGETKKMIVKCNFSNQDPEDSNADEYLFFIDESEIATDVEAEDEDGDDVTASVGTAGTNEGTQTTVVEITETGSLTVSLDGSTPKSSIILGNATGVGVATYKFQADDEAFLVKELTLANCATSAADANGTCGDAGDEADGADDIAASVKLSYLTQAGATETKTGFLTGGSVNFNGLNFYVPANGTRMLTVSVDTGAVSSVGAASGDMIQLNLDIEDSGAATFEAVGVSSGETVDESDVDTYIVANDMTVRKTKPTLSLASGSPSGAGIPGLSEAFRFNIAADSRGYVTLNAITFKVTSSDGGASDWNQCGDGAATQHFALDALWELYDADDTSEKLDVGGWTFLNSAGVDCADTAVDLKYAQLVFPTAEEIGAGETKTYVLRVDTGVNGSGAGASASDDDSLRIDLPDEAELDALATTDRDAINWEDDIETPAAGTSCDVGADPCIDGTLVKNLPVTGGTIVY